MDLGDILKHGPRVSDVEINRRKRRHDIGVPQGVTAITENGLRIPCAVNFAGTERHDGRTLPVYKVLAELDWRTTRIIRVEIRKWPDNVVVLFDFGGEPGDLPPSWIKDIEWAEVK